ncbi:hypothetical protein N665_2372s0008 [Sinapis alba]|nr:hypothetical protein N665_2372s0008 [Sinapis alba]
MEIEESSSTTHLESILVQRKTLQNLLHDCQRALQQIDVDNNDRVGKHSDSPDRKEELSLSSSDSGDPEADKLYDLIKSRVECHDFRDRLQLAQASLLLQDIAGIAAAEDGSSWDVVSDDDLNIWGMEDDYVVVREEDIADAIASFMVTYLSSLEQTKDVSPDQLQKALSTMFSVKKRKGKLRKAWEGSKVIYNLASWSASAIGYIEQ